MAANQPQQEASSSAPPSQEYIVRVSRDVKKKHSILKFNPSNNVDFTKGLKASLQRENNFKEFKDAYDIDAMPKFGAGSEFGREAREEARRKKYGIKSKVYVPANQPWTMKLGTDTAMPRKFKGIKEGGVLENTSYYIFTQCPDGAFEAFPVEEWYNFTPVACYKVLNAEEAEKEFERREQRHNYFNIMVSKRMRKDDDGDDGKELDDDGKKVKKSKKKDFVLTELDEWAVLSEDDSANDSDQSDSEKKEKKEKKKKKPTTKKKRGKKSGRKNSDSEAMEESDDMDEGKEVDYMTDSDSEDDDMYADTAKMKSDKYDDKGVVEEDGLRKLIDSDDEDEDEKKEEEDEAKEEDEEEGKEGKPERGSDSESSSSSDSDSDVEKTANLPSALFMKKSEKVSKKNKSADNTPTNSRSATPTIPNEDKSKKRKAAETDLSGNKKARVSTPTPTGASGASASDGITEELVRRYLMRKPMTTKELLIKFRNTGLSKEARVTQLAQILKRLNPDKKKIQDQLYLSIKKPE